MLFYFLLALLEGEIDLCDFLFDLFLDIDAADGAEGVEFGFGFSEFLDKGIFGEMQFGSGILGAIAEEGADCFLVESAGHAGFGISGYLSLLLLLHFL